MNSGLFKNVIHKMCLEIIYIIYMDEKDLAWNNLQWLVCHKIWKWEVYLFVTSSHETGLDTRSMTKRSIIENERCICLSLPPTRQGLTQGQWPKGRLLKMRGVFVCHCLPSDRTWHKVNDPEVDYWKWEVYDKSKIIIAQLAGAVEYTDCTSAEG